MPNINFNASVIRLGLPDQQRPPPNQNSSGNWRGSNAEPLGNRRGLGAGGDRNIERDRAAVRESMMALQPPTREEVARTIFIGGLGEGAPDDEKIEDILRCAGKLRRWTRARDAEDKMCKFGFAEFEDVDSLEAANIVFEDLEVPVFDKAGSVMKDDEGEVKKTKLLVVVDGNSKAYIEEWKGKGKNQDENARQFRLDGCKEDLRQTLASFTNAGAFLANGEQGENGDINMSDPANGDPGENGAEIVTIPVTLEDELADIPADMRATVAEEIRAFRDRSNKRDIERMKREEELEQAERQRSGLRINRLASPPPSSAPSGPAGAANGIPSGPRGLQNAPSGPRGYRGAQLPNDYVNGVAFVSANGGHHREDEDDPASDEELERRRKAKKDADIEQEFSRMEEQWRRREKTRGAALEREREREGIELRKKQKHKDDIARQLREFNDDDETRRLSHEFYADRTAWSRRRAGLREAEERKDAFDRDEENREKAEERRRHAEARGMADDFMERMDVELSSSQAQQQPSSSSGAGVKISLGSAAARTKAAAAAAAQTTVPKRGLADVEGLLEDEEDAAASNPGLSRPKLQPLPATSSVPATEMSEEEIAAARKRLASEIPTRTDELFATALKYDFLTREVMNKQIRPFVEKKIVEFLGVQEDLLVEAVVSGIDAQKGAAEIVGELEEVFEKEEAEGLVKKVWRLGVFWGECGARGLT
jgi:hypothetical protein